MSESKNVIFKTAVSGYNKKDVNEYIIRTSEDFKEKEAFLRERLEKAEKETERLSGELQGSISSEQEAKAKFEEINAAYNAVCIEKEALDIKIAELEEKLSLCETTVNSEREAVIAKQFEQIEEMRAEIEELKEKLSNSGNNSGSESENARKALLYDKTSANIGEAIISAKKAADEILSSAKEEARLITEKTEREIEEKIRAVEEGTQIAYEAIFSKLIAAASENKREIISASAFAERVLAEAISNINAKNRSVASKIKNCETETWKSIKRDIESVGNMRTRGKLPKSEGLKKRS